MKSLFLVENLNVVVIYNKIYARDRTVHISRPETYRGKVLKVYHINHLFNLFPCHNFGENYRENDQNDSLESSY